jgi:hypothetical protein
MAAPEASRKRAMLPKPESVQQTQSSARPR